MNDTSLFVPTGNVVGIFWVLIAVFVVGAGWRTRLLALALATAAIALPYLLPDAWLVSWLPYSPRAAFLLGFLPPLATAALVLFLKRRREREPAPRAPRSVEVVRPRPHGRSQRQRREGLRPHVDHLAAPLHPPPDEEER